MNLTQIYNEMLKERDLKKRTKAFCVECIKLTEKLPKTYLGNHVKGQFIRCSSSVAANYRAANLAQSTPAFISKLSIVIEEADESVYWLELMNELNLIDSSLRDELEKEGLELVAIFVSSRKKLKNRTF